MSHSCLHFINAKRHSYPILCFVDGRTQRFWYTGLKRAIQAMMERASFGDTVTTDRKLPEPNIGTPWACAAFGDINKKVGGVFYQKAPEGSSVPYHTVASSVGFDEVQVFDNSARSTGILALPLLFAFPVKGTRDWPTCARCCESC